MAIATRSYLNMFSVKIMHVNSWSDEDTCPGDSGWEHGRREDDLHLNSTLALFCSILDRQNEKKHTSPWRTILQLENIDFGFVNFSYQTVREVLILREVKNFLGGIFFVFQILFHRMLLFCFALSVYMRYSISQVTSFLRTQKQSV